MRKFKDIVCPGCKKDFPVGFSEGEQFAKGKNIICRNQFCRLHLWIPLDGKPQLVKIKKIDWQKYRNDN